MSLCSALLLAPTSAHASVSVVFLCRARAQGRPPARGAAPRRRACCSRWRPALPAPLAQRRQGPRLEGAAVHPRVPVYGGAPAESARPTSLSHGCAQRRAQAQGQRPGDRSAACRGRARGPPRPTARARARLRRRRSTTSNRPGRQQGSGTGTGPGSSAGPRTLPRGCPPAGRAPAGPRFTLRARAPVTPRPRERRAQTPQRPAAHFQPTTSRRPPPPLPHRGSLGSVPRTYV